MESIQNNKVKAFYDREYIESRYANYKNPSDHPLSKELESFIDKYQIHEKRCLEIGCGRGLFQDCVSNYTGIDFSNNVNKYLHKPFYQASATKLPFTDNTFDAIWTIEVLEHVPKPYLAIEEMRRVLKNNGVLFLAPAWQCRPWAAKGYPVRPYSDFNLIGKLIKLSIPVRNSVFFRSLYIFPKRIFKFIKFIFTRKPLDFNYKKLTPNYEYFWMSDSDAINTMDPYEAILWFVSRGDTCLSYPNWMSKFFVRTGAIVFRINK